MCAVHRRTEASLSRWEEGDEKKSKRAPVREDYDSRCLPIPEGLQGEHSRETPENFKSKEGEDKVPKRLWAGDGIRMKDSPIVSFSAGHISDAKDDTLLLYLANDYHWREARLVRFSGAGLAVLQFQNENKEVQLSRCVFVETAKFKNRVDTLACTEDYSKRVLDLPYGYRNEKLVVKWSRWNMRRDLRSKVKLWLEKAQDRSKMLSPREAA